MEDEELKKQQDKTLRLAELESLKPIEYWELELIFKKWLLIPDTSIIRFICAIYCANKLPIQPPWAIIIAPSGGGKTEFLNSLLDLSDVYEISLLTPNTFLSGVVGGKGASLLPKVNGKILIFKDWTTILSMQKDSRAEIMSQFREIYDGGMTKITGTGKVLSWKGKVSILAASTQAVDLNQQMFTHLGERFINYRIVMPDGKEVAMKTLNNNPEQDKMKDELKKAMYSFFKGIDFNLINGKDVLNNDIKKEIVELANFVAKARSAVIRDSGFKKEVIFVPATEMPTRISAQLNCLATGCAVINKGLIANEDIKLIYKCALDSIPQTNMMVIQQLARGDEQTTAEVATALGYPTEPIRMYLENLALLKICKRIKDHGKADRWTMKNDFVLIMRKHAGVVEFVTGEREMLSERAKNESREEIIQDDLEFIDPDFGKF